MVDLDATLETLPTTQTHVVGAAIFRPAPTSSSSSSSSSSSAASPPPPPRAAQLLILKRSPLARVFPNSWEIPGGHVDPGETVREAVVRETREETGLAVDRVAAEFAPLVWISKKKDEDAGGRENVQYNFVVRLSPREEEMGEPEIQLSEREHSEYKWIGEDEVAGVECNEAMRGVLRDAFAAVEL